MIRTQIVRPSNRIRNSRVRLVAASRRRLRAVVPRVSRTVRALNARYRQQIILRKQSVQPSVRIVSPKTNNNKAVRRATTALVQMPQMGQVQSGPIKNAWINNPYTMCRLFPFHSDMASMGIPDQTETRRLVVDHRMINTFTVGTSGLLNIAITPTVPNPIWVNTGSIIDTAWRINGVNFAQYNSGTPSLYVPICLPEWINQTITRNSTAGEFNTVQTLYNSGKFRLVTVGWSITYIGNVTQNSGQITVTNQRIDSGGCIPNTVLLEAFSSQSPSNTNYTPNQVLINIMDIAPQFGSGVNTASKCFALSTGCSGLLKHSTSNFQYAQLSNNESYLVTTANTEYALLQQAYPTPMTVGGSGITCGFDSDWDTTLISVVGATTGTSFVLDTIYCIEYIPSPGSSVYALSTPGPKENLTVIRKTSELARKMPIAQAGDCNSSGGVNEILNKVLTVAEGVGRVAKTVMSVM
jgi:hypothetical protein